MGPLIYSTPVLYWIKHFRLNIGNTFNGLGHIVESWSFGVHTMLQFYNEHYHYYIESDVEKFLGTSMIGRLGKRPSEDYVSLSFLKLLCKTENVK